MSSAKFSRAARIRELRARYAGEIMAGMRAKGKGMLDDSEMAGDAVRAATALTEEVVARESREGLIDND